MFMCWGFSGNVPTWSEAFSATQLCSRTECKSSSSLATAFPAWTLGGREMRVLTSWRKNCFSLLFWWWVCGVLVWGFLVVIFISFFFKPEVKPLLFRVLFSMKGEVFSVWLLRHEHIAKKCIAENRSLASHTIEVTSITKSEVLKGLWQFSLAALCEGNASFASVWQQVKTAV